MPWQPYSRVVNTPWAHCFRMASGSACLPSPPLLSWYEWMPVSLPGNRYWNLQTNTSLSVFSLVINNNHDNGRKFHIHIHGVHVHVCVFTKFISQYQFQEPGASVSRSAADKEGWPSSTVYEYERSASTSPTPFKCSHHHAGAKYKVQSTYCRAHSGSCWLSIFPRDQKLKSLLVKDEWSVSTTGEQQGDMGGHKTAPVHQRTQAEEVHTHGRKWGEYMPRVRTCMPWVHVYMYTRL
jgi:hypothetical protein